MNNKIKNLDGLDMCQDLNSVEMEELKGGYTPIPDEIKVDLGKFDFKKLDLCAHGQCFDDLWRFDRTREFDVSQRFGSGIGY